MNELKRVLRIPAGIGNRDVLYAFIADVETGKPARYTVTSLNDDETNFFVVTLITPAAAYGQ